VAEFLGVIVGVVVLGFVAGLFAIKRILFIVQPSEVVIISGPRRAGQRVGYRFIRGGRGIRIPFLELIDRMDLTTMGVDVQVRNGYSRDGIPLTIQGVANIKIDGDPPGLDNAVEKLMGKTREQIARIARETLEGNLRGVLARLTPEQVNEDKESFAGELIEEAEVDLQRLGLVLDTLKIQTVADDVGYLDSIGRAKNAELVKRSRMAEAERKAEAAIRAAENMRQTRISQIAAEVDTARAQADKRLIDARTRRAAEVAREQSTVLSEIARAQSELAVQTARIEEVKLALDADVVAPAKAYRAQKEAEARAAVAPIIEDGRASAEGLRKLAARWAESGDQAREIFLLEKLDALVKLLVDTVQDVSIDRMTVISEGDHSTAGQSASLVEQVRSATGVDIPAMARRIGAGVTGAGPPPVPRGPSEG
jgi:flotillin